jgi:F0F1-type ATP synthase assembly protein I
MGWYVALCIVIGIIGGLKLDDIAGTRPLFTLLGVLLGTVAAFYGIYKMALPLLKEQDTKTDTMTDGGKT